MGGSNKNYTIIEYGGFSRGSKPPPAGYQPLPEGTFDALEDLILANNSEKETETEACELLSLSSKHGVKTITAKNYVGVVTMRDGTVVEILPKIYGGDVGVEETRRIFLAMLRALNDVSFKAFNFSSLRAERLTLFEVFISMFIAEVATLVKQGLKSWYIPVEANERFFKGKVNVARDIKDNFARRDRVFVEYDEWSLDRPENRLLKETLLFLCKQTGSSRNRQDIMRLLCVFDAVTPSADIEGDFSKCSVSRMMSHYEKALSWCRLFLRRNSFTAFAGSEIAVALLFPMEKVFESYVARKLRQAMPYDAELSTQDGRYSLFKTATGGKAFRLRPDIVLCSGEGVFVMDTKWKLLDVEATNYGIAQADMYQMYAYGKKYNAKKVILIYPQPDNYSGGIISFSSGDGVAAEIAFIDLMDPDGSLAALSERLRGRPHA